MMILVLKFLVIAVWASLALVTAFTRFVRGDINSHSIDLFDASGPSLSSRTDLPRARSCLLSLNPNDNLGRTLSTMTARRQNGAHQRDNFMHCHRNLVTVIYRNLMRKIQTTFAHVFAAFAGKAMKCRGIVIPVIAALI